MEAQRRRLGARRTGVRCVGKGMRGRGTHGRSGRVGDERMDALDAWAVRDVPGRTVRRVGEGRVCSERMDAQGHSATSRRGPFSFGTQL